MTFLLLLRLVSISILCIPYTSHVYSFQSMYTSRRPSLPTRSDGCTPHRSITRFSRCSSPLNASSSTGLSHAERWEKMYNLLCRYSEREGHVNVPRRHVEDGENLGHWLQNQRQRYSKLQPERQNKLELLGVELSITNELRWEKMYNLLCRYSEREGHVNVPFKHVEDGENLGHWLNHQRANYKAGNLQLKRQNKLELLGVELQIIYELQWEKNLDLLCTYKEREGHVNVPQKHVEDGENLGQWLSNQRANYMAGNLQPERQNQLESFGVLWDMTHVHQRRLDMQWEKMFDLLCIYKEREGHANVPGGHQEDGQELGNWVLAQIRAYRLGRLQAEREIKLESLGMQWEPQISVGIRGEKAWQRKFNLLCIFKEREGHTNVAKDHQESGETLGLWLCHQRQMYRYWALHPERQSKLESLGVQWDGLRGKEMREEIRWENMITILRTYKEREGNTEVPYDHQEGGENLGAWLQRQRSLYKAGTLRPERQNKLESLGVRLKLRLCDVQAPS